MDNQTYPLNLQTRLLTLFLPILFFFAFSFIFVKFPKLYLFLVIEDSVIEYSQAVCFLIASLIGFVTAYQLFKIDLKLKFVVILLFAIGSFLICGEEISWGQRIIGFVTPATINEINVQREFTAHNLNFIQPCTGYAYYAICGFACLAWLIFYMRSFQHRHLLRYIIPGWETITLFAPIAFFYYIHGLYFSSLPISKCYFVWPEIKSWQHQEVFELFFAVGFIVVALRNFFLAKSESLNKLVSS